MNNVDKEQINKTFATKQGKVRYAIKASLHTWGSMEENIFRDFASFLLRVADRAT